MSLLKVKNGANLVLSVEMAICLGWVARRWAEHSLGEFVVTSGRDGAHRQGSLHYSGNAVDIRTRHLFAPNGKHAQELLDFADMLQDKKIGLRVVVHPDWDLRPGTPAHLHIGFQPREDEKLWDWTE